jgi:hypothetical protein
LAAVLWVNTVFFKLHPKQFRKAENIGFDRLGNKNLTPIPVVAQTICEANITFADGNGFLLFGTRIFFGIR